MKLFILISFLKDPLFLGDVPTAYLPKRGNYEIDLRLQKEGGLILKMETGITEYLSIGVSYGGMNVIGEKDIEFYPLPGIILRYLAIYEGDFPAFSIGISTCGYDRYLNKMERYEVKSKGIYAAFSKSYVGMGGIVLNGGLNYTFERKDEKNGFDIFSSISLIFSPEFGIFSDLSFGFNDNYNKNGLLNIGFEFSFEETFFLRCALRNILNKDYINRVIEIGYRGNL